MTYDATARNRPRKRSILDSFVETFFDLLGFAAVLIGGLVEVLAKRLAERGWMTPLVRPLCGLLPRSFLVRVALEEFVTTPPKAITRAEVDAAWMVFIAWSSFGLRAGKSHELLRLFARTNQSTPYDEILPVSIVLYQLLEASRLDAIQRVVGELQAGNGVNFSAHLKSVALAGGSWDASVVDRPDFDALFKPLSSPE